ncbi:Ef-Hand Calcium-Binding Domain-Containing Protein 4A [Manis pentadactyla]|nr:Ef-Hand Calcium-Binding Domain-Containing Protein 4A [Manis pentadactyla]
MPVLFNYSDDVLVVASVCNDDSQLEDDGTIALALSSEHLSAGLCLMRDREQKVSAVQGTLEPPKVAHGRQNIQAQRVVPFPTLSGPVSSLLPAGGTSDQVCDDGGPLGRMEVILEMIFKVSVSPPYFPSEVESYAIYGIAWALQGHQNEGSKAHQTFFERHRRGITYQKLQEDG